MRIGYARVSTQDQHESLAAQKKLLQDYGCARIYTDIASGAQAARPSLSEAIDYVREGDSVVVTRLDRLGRTTLDTLRTIQELDERGIRVEALDVSLDTATPAGKLVLNVIASLAQWERDLLIERTQEGLAHARSQGRVGGRPRIPEEKRQAVLAALESGLSQKQVVAAFGISRSSVARIKASHKRV